MLAAVRSVLPLVTPDQVLRLDIMTEEPSELPIVWMLCEALGYIWKQRTFKNRTTLFDLKAHVNSKLTHLASVHPTAEFHINNMINQM